MLGGELPAVTAAIATYEGPHKEMPDAQKADADKSAMPAKDGKKADEKTTSKQMDAPEGSEIKSDEADGKKSKKKKKNMAMLEDERLRAGANGGKSKSEMAVLEGLASRRKDLDSRARELNLRENLLKAAEKRVDARITELKLIEKRIEGELNQRDDYRNEQYGRLVKMYSGMKPKDAARIFNRLDMNVLTGLVAKMKPRIMSAILAAMAPAAAERLTLEIAHSGLPTAKVAATLPRIPSQRNN